MGEPPPGDEEPPLLDHVDRRALLRRARESLEAALLGRPAPSAPDSKGVRRSGGAFVSLHRRTGELRGCVGLLRSEAPLVETVARMAVAAATEDRRFPPVTTAELGEIVVEVSALGPLRRARPEEVEVGRHGLLLRVAGATGVLLPQVAVEHGWEREEFLGKTAWKAGLPEDAWRREDAELFVFTAEVFGEEAG
jgi:AmmeMemoRadiSam system protein A